MLPPDPALAFIDYLIEDFWRRVVHQVHVSLSVVPRVDADNAGTLSCRWVWTSLPADTHQTFKRVFTERQVGRLYVVGSNDITAPVIDASYRRFLAAMEAHLGAPAVYAGNVRVRAISPCSDS
ncbi:MAG: hypothetical protein R3E50_10080 [Halioglobus sp.]